MRVRARKEEKAKASLTLRDHSTYRLNGRISAAHLSDILSSTFPLLQRHKGKVACWLLLAGHTTIMLHKAEAARGRTSYLTCGESRGKVLQASPLGKPRIETHDGDTRVLPPRLISQSVKSL